VIRLLSTEIFRPGKFILPQSYLRHAFADQAERMHRAKRRSIFETQVA
jgi:hypothetical protein